MPLAHPLGICRQPHLQANIIYQISGDSVALISSANPVTDFIPAMLWAVEDSGAYLRWKILQCLEKAEFCLESYAIVKSYLMDGILNIVCITDLENGLRFPHYQAQAACLVLIHIVFLSIEGEGSLSFLSHLNVWKCDTRKHLCV